MTIREVATADELGALPIGSVVLDAERCAWQKWDDTERWGDDDLRLPEVWACPAYSDDWTSEEMEHQTSGPHRRHIGPFRVIYNPADDPTPRKDSL